MSNRTFYILDVFAENRYSGNQLAVVLDAVDLSRDEMQTITREFNFSETTFIQSGLQKNGGYDVRIFTPGAEVPFAGHPTVGTGWVLRYLVARDQVETVKLNLQVGQIPVTFDSETNVTWMTTKEPTFAQTFTAEKLAPILGVEAEAFDPCYPCQLVSTGLPHIIVPLQNLEAVQQVEIQINRLKALADSIKLPGLILVFCTETIDPANQIHARMFGPLLGVAEDPATGSANSCLAGYLVEHEVLGGSTIDIQVEQGIEICRPSRLYLKADKMETRYNIQVGGKVQLVAKGTLLD